jgi:hypothetical protein
VSLYRAGSRAASSITDDGEVPGGGALMVAVRLEDVVSPLRNGRPLAEGDRSALVIGGTEKICTGDASVFLQVVAVAPARVRRARPLKTGSLDGTLIRVPDTPANRAAFGSTGTSDGPAPFPQLRALPLNDVSTLLGSNTRLW